MFLVLGWSFPKNILRWLLSILQPICERDTATPMKNFLMIYYNLPNYTYHIVLVGVRIKDIMLLADPNKITMLISCLCSAAVKPQFFG